MIYLEIIRNLVKKINIKALKSGADNLLLENNLLSEEMNLENEEVLKQLHLLLFEVHIQDGYLICPESNRKFPIKDGIPNMLLHEDEI